MDKIIKQLLQDKIEEEGSIIQKDVWFGAFYQEGLEDMAAYFKIACDPFVIANINDRIKGYLHSGDIEDVRSYMTALGGFLNEMIKEMRLHADELQQQLDQLKAQGVVADIERRAALLELETIKEQLKRLI